MHTPEELPDLEQRLAAAHARIERGNRERAAGADDKARALADEVARRDRERRERGRSRGGARELADELGVSEQTISKAISRARQAHDPARTLPLDTLERLLAAELETVPPLTARQWQALAHLVRGTFIDATWIEQPGQLLAYEVEDAELEEEFEPDALAQACRGLTRVQAVAVIDACQRNDLAALPVTGPRPRQVTLVCAVQGDQVPGVEISAPDSPIEWADLPADARAWAEAQGYGKDDAELLYVLSDDDSAPAGYSTFTANL